MSSHLLLCRLLWTLSTCFPEDRADRFWRGLPFLLLFFALAIPRSVLRIVGSIKGAILFFLFGWHLAVQLASGHILPTHPNGTSISGALFYFTWLGIPGAANALKLQVERRLKEPRIDS